MNRRGFVARVLGVLAVGPLAKYLPAAEPDWKTLPGTPTPITFKGIPIVYDDQRRVFLWNMTVKDPRHLSVITGITEG